MRKLLVANFKMNPGTLAEAKKLSSAISKAAKKRNVKVVICPPFPYIAEIGTEGDVCLGAQDSFWAVIGPYTGEVSPSCLKELGVKYVILGHSERRKWLKETDDMINAKIREALIAGLKVILCVGESAAVRKKGIGAAKRYVRGQLATDLKGVLGSAFFVPNSNLVIAYEPVWAIGTGKPDKPEETENMASFIKSIVPVAVLYGGSVNSKNAGTFLKLTEIDGALVGGASLNPVEFGKIINLASKLKN